jgi:hypothetical protein
MTDPTPQGSIEIVETIPFEEEVHAGGGAVLYRRMAPLGIPEARIRDLEGTLGGLIVPIGAVTRGVGEAFGAGAGILNGIRRLLWKKEEHYRIEDITTLRVHVPLFRLQAPKTPKAKVKYTLAVETAGEAGWELKIFGSGGGSSVTMKVKHSTTFEASDGACKLIFAPVVLKVSRLSLLSGGRVTGTAVQAEVDRSTAGDFVNGIEVLDTARCSRFDATDRQLFTLPLKDDTTGDLAQHERAVEAGGAIEASLGFKAFDIDSGVKAKVERKEEVSLSLEVPSGHDYDVFGCRGIDGITCVVR